LIAEAHRVLRPGGSSALRFDSIDAGDSSGGPEMQR